VRQGAGIILSLERDLGEGDVSRLVNEAPELGVRDRRAIHPERVDRHPVGRRFFGIVAVGAHAEVATGEPDHARVAGQGHRPDRRLRKIDRHPVLQPRSRSPSRPIRRGAGFN